MVYTGMLLQDQIEGYTTWYGFRDAGSYPVPLV